MSAWNVAFSSRFIEEVVFVIANHVQMFASKLHDRMNRIVACEAGKVAGNPLNSRVRGLSHGPRKQARYLLDLQERRNGNPPDPITVTKLPGSWNSRHIEIQPSIQTCAVGNDLVLQRTLVIVAQ
jgi:hypothetical protein